MHLNQTKKKMDEWSTLRCFQSDEQLLQHGELLQNQPSFCLPIWNVLLRHLFRDNAIIFIFHGWLLICKYKTFLSFSFQEYLR